MAVLLISESYLKSRSIINEHVDFELLKPAIFDAQDIHIQSIIGTGIYNQIQSEVTANVFTGLNRTLLDSYILPALVQWTLVEASPSLAFRIANKGLMVKSAENAQPISESAILKYVDDTRNKAEWRSERITKYIQANITSFPLYSNPGSGVDIIHPKRDNFKCGIYLGVTSDKKRSFEERYQGNIDSDC